MRRLRVAELDPQDYRRWERFVAAHPDALVYHLPVWLQVLQRAFSYETVPLGCEDAEGRLVGVLPLLYKRGLLTGRQISSLPHTPVAGRLSSHPGASAALIERAMEMVQGRSRAWLLLKLPPSPAPVVDGLQAVPWRKSYVLDLPERGGELQLGSARNHRKIRSAVRKTFREGVNVRPAETERELAEWYELYLETLRRHGVPPLPYRFFQVMWELLRPKGHMRLLLAEQARGPERRLLAGSLYLMFGNRVFFAFNGRSLREPSSGANDAIKWQAIHLTSEEGYRYFDLGEVSEGNESLARFKRKWGSDAEQLYRYYYPASREPESGALSSGSKAREIITHGWRRLPLPATRLFGYWLYRYL